MTPEDAFYATVFDSPGGPESLAPRLGMSAQVLRNKANPNIETNHPTLRDIRRAMSITGDLGVLHALAQEQSHVCIPVESDGQASDMAVLELIARVWQTNGCVGTAVNETLADGRVEKHEIDKVADQVHRTVTALHELLGRLKGMAEK